jgi:SAM-dependent methyltransferase
MSVEHLKELQIEHANQSFKAVHPGSFEGGLYHDHFREIPFLRTQALLERAGVDLNGKRVLIASCGTGIDVYYLKKYFNCIFFVTDISENAVAIAKASFPGIEGQVEDGEKLSFSDDSFDYTFIAASLHHFPRPILGLYELMRVSKEGVIVIEPNDSWLTRIATALGLATEVEESGNYVYRLSKHDVARIAKSLFVRFEVDRFFAVHRIAKTKGEFFVLKILNGLANWIVPSFGNYIAFFISKQRI